MEILILLLGLAIGLALGWFIGRVSGRSGEAVTLRERLAAADATNLQLERQVAELKSQVSQRDAQNEQENRILQALSPVTAQLTEMQRRVSQLGNDNSQQFGEIQAGLKASLEIGDSLRKETNALSKAMGDTKSVGYWGEIQLRRLVEHAGLLNQVDFIEQEKTNIDGQSFIPDLVVKLPGGGSLPVDSKVPLAAFLEASAIEDSAPKELLHRRDVLLKKHATDLKSHIQLLGSKKYWQGYNGAPEFVIAFIPSESLLSAAVQADASIIEWAMERNVVLASPVNLYSLLKAVALIWQNNANQEALAKVIELGKQIFTRLNVVARHAESLGKHLDASVEEYNKFVGSIERNLLTTARELNQQEAVQFGLISIAEPAQITKESRSFAKKELIVESDKPLDD
jgi:DNA recombination protein RmuC